MPMSARPRPPAGLRGLGLSNTRAGWAKEVHYQEEGRSLTWESTGDPGSGSEWFRAYGWHTAEAP